MIRKLENIVLNTGKGFITGAVNLLDPIGSIASDVDYWVSGVGPCDKRSLPTFFNDVYKKLYKKPNEKVDFASGYVPRFLGYLAGGIGAAIGLGELYLAGGLFAALAIPAGLGIYSGIGAVGKYIKDMVKGESVGEIPGEKAGEGPREIYEKSTFYNGFKLGYHETSHLDLFRSLFVLEKDMSGRNLGNSHIYSSMNESAVKMRRNFSSVAGFVAGSLVGAAVSIYTLGIVPIYKSIRDTVRNFEAVKS